MLPRNPDRMAGLSAGARCRLKALPEESPDTLSLDMSQPAELEIDTEPRRRFVVPVGCGDLRHALNSRPRRVRDRAILVYEDPRMRSRSPSLIVVLTIALLSSFVLSGCPARRASGSPADLDPTFLDRA